MDCFHLCVAPESVALLEETGVGGGVRGGAVAEFSGGQWWLPPPVLQSFHRFGLCLRRVVRPDKSSATYTSVSGNVDKRLDLDKSITNESSKYNASLAVMASKLSYENESFVRNVVTHNWQLSFKKPKYNVHADYQELNTTYAMMFQDKNADPNLIIVSFRGTEPFDTDTWRTDIDISWCEFQGIGKIHGGFMKALGLHKSTGWPKDISPGKLYAYYTIREKLKTLVQENRNAKFILTGHSMGGALAILFAGVLAIHEEELLLKRLEECILLGSQGYVYSNDMVPRLPYDDKTFLFKHFGPCLFFNSCYKGQVLEEEPNKNYFSLLHVVPKILNAVYELIRGFILPWTKGEEYREGWFMKLFRVTALVIPGLTDHFLVDYVNLTRLGKLPSSIYPRGPNQIPKQD
ncbi:hypothetical protein DH2020_035392 [Rehmannia glutinosa]|uniref:Fungal lipase-type domain-containing protein n=1 Tax=Rehmannia glutinosa TaxID=99300 RepID=A0ABR0V9W9_REHGL